MRVATWNVNSLKARLLRVEEWLAYADVDVLCLQETKLSDAAFPAMTFEALGYTTAQVGQGQWNGVAILSRVGITDVVSGFAPAAIDDVAQTAPHDDYTAGVLGEARVVTANCNGVTVCSVYVPNGRSLDDPHLQAKLVWLKVLKQHFTRLSSPEAPIVLCGDFNIAPDDHDVWDIKKFSNSTHVSADERARLTELRDWGFADLFRQFYPDNGLYTYWDYRAGDFHQHRGMRIDLMYGTPTICERMTWAFMDRNARKGKLPSDHAPVIVDFAWP